jgi:hypothetical protein
MGLARELRLCFHSSPTLRASMTTLNDATPAGSTAICAVNPAEVWKEVS